MGTDIHISTETKKNGSWFQVRKGLVSDFYQKDNDYFGEEKFKNGPYIYQGRNYTLFAYLANVRNGVGFAGCDLGDPIEPISIPRGIPLDVSKGVKKEIEEWGKDGHSWSYFYLDELKKAYKKSKKILQTERGVVNKKEYKEFKLKGYPSNYSGGVFGQGIKMVENELMDKIIEGKVSFEHPYKFYTTIEWKIFLEENIKGFFNHVILQLEKLLLKKDIEDVRIVFWFDS